MIDKRVQRFCHTQPSPHCNPSRCSISLVLLYLCAIVYTSQNGKASGKSILQPNNTKGNWKGFAAMKKLSQAAKVPEERSKQWLFKQALWQIYLPGPCYVTWPTPSTKLIFFFCRMTSCLVAAKLTNTRLPLSTLPTVTKKLSLWPRKTLLKLRRLFSLFTRAALWISHRCSSWS